MDSGGQRLRPRLWGLSFSVLRKLRLCSNWADAPPPFLEWGQMGEREVEVWGGGCCAGPARKVQGAAQAEKLPGGSR